MKQTLKYIYERLIDSLKIAEGKHSITIALASGVIILGSTFINGTVLTVKILAGGTIVFALVSVICGFLALFARTIKEYKKTKIKKDANLLYYKHIMKFDAESYINAIKKNYGFPRSYKPDGFDIDLAKNVIAQARVVYLKLWYFNISLFFLILSVLLAVIMVLILGNV